MWTGKGWLWMGALLVLLTGTGACGPPPVDVPGAHALVEPRAPQRSALSAEPVSFRYDDFSDISTLRLNGSASQLGARLRLTVAPAPGNQAGNGFHLRPTVLAPDHSFSTYFRMQITDGGDDQTPADGIVFVVQGNSPGALGAYGLDIGYGGIPQSLGVELDTFPNAQLGDMDNHHLGTHLNGDMSRHLAYQAVPDQWSDGSEYSVWVDYDGSVQQLEVRYARNSDVRPAAPSLTQTLDLSAVYGSDTVYPGFTSGTASAWSNHWIDTWYFQDHYAPIDLSTRSYSVTAAQVTLAASSPDPERQLTLSVRVEDVDGRPVEGSEVTLSSSLGVLSADTVTTDANGQATLTLTGEDQAGAAHVVATDGAVNGTLDVRLLGTLPIQASATGAGTISPSGTIRVAPGSSATFRFEPQGTNRVGMVSVDGQSVGRVSEYTFASVSAPHTVEVLFVPHDYGLSFSCASSPERGAPAALGALGLLVWLEQRKRTRRLSR